MPGKLRIARFALRPFRKMGQAGATQAFLHSLSYRTFRIERRGDDGYVRLSALVNRERYVGIAAVRSVAAG